MYIIHILDNKFGPGGQICVVILKLYSIYNIFMWINICIFYIMLIARKGYETGWSSLCKLLLLRFYGIFMEKKVSYNTCIILKEFINYLNII